MFDGIRYGKARRCCESPCFIGLLIIYLLTDWLRTGLNPLAPTCYPTTGVSWTPGIGGCSGIVGSLLAATATSPNRIAVHLFTQEVNF